MKSYYYLALAAAFYWLIIKTETYYNSWYQLTKLWASASDLYTYWFFILVYQQVKNMAYGSIFLLYLYHYQELSSHIESHIRPKILFEFLRHIFANKVVCHRILSELFKNSACLSRFCVNGRKIQYSEGSLMIFNI